MTEAKVIKYPITMDEVRKMAEDDLGDMVKATVDIKQEIIAIGGQYHGDQKELLMGDEYSRWEDIWGINIYPNESGEEQIIFDSLVNVKPQFDNNSREVINTTIQDKVKEVVNKLIWDK